MRGATYGGSLTFRKFTKKPEILLNTRLRYRKARDKATSVNPFIRRKKVLFLCVENSCRSLMAQAFASFTEVMPLKRKAPEARREKKNMI